MLLEIVKYFRNSLSDIEKLALHPTFSTCEDIVFFHKEIKIRDGGWNAGELKSHDKDL